MNYYISDLHFGHKRMINLESPEFKSIEERDALIISNWNNTVGMEDDVYILGDISFYNSSKTCQIINELNGIKHLIRGNHDSHVLRNKDLQKQFVEICDYKELTWNDKDGLVLCHYPIPCFKNHYYGWHHFYGHVHETFEWQMMEKVKSEMIVSYNHPCNMYNIGCSMPYINFTPRTFEEITATERKEGNGSY